MSEVLYQICWIGLHVLVLGAGIGFLLSRDLVKAVLFFFLILVGVAGMFVFAGAEFLAMSQLLVYVGGILILVIFGIMLTRKSAGLKPAGKMINLIPAALISSVILGGLLFFIWTHDFGHPDLSVNHSNDLKIIGVQTITTYLFPFEFLSILLLVALIGAAYLSKKRGPAS